MPTRTTPFDVAFAPFADERFPPIRDGIAAAGANGRDRDAFLMIPEAVTLVRDLRPDESPGEAIDQLTALIHHAYLFWDAGQRTVAFGRAETVELLDRAGPTPVVCDCLPLYAQLPPRLIWAQPVEGGPHEPLDGCFLHTATDPEGSLRVLGVFGLHPDRPGFTVVEASGPRPGPLARADGAPPFAPALAGGAAAGLRSVTGGDELLELGWRLVAGRAATRAGGQETE
ncbi:MAG TPA: hypothetical protein VFU46_10310 [Gemmatimonadales bacterium]|nr:hypothetical protein [Gemmatimonadales bacterium]